MAKKRIPKKVDQEVGNFILSLKKDHLPINEVFLFGSYAKGRGGKWSDIDLCVISPKFSDPWKALRYLWQKVPYPTDSSQPAIEPVGFAPKDFKQGSSLINEIKKTGIRISI